MSTSQRSYFSFNPILASVVTMLLASVFLVSTISAAPANTITVNTNNDIFDVIGSDCSTVTIIELPGTDGLISLREAICAANNTVAGGPHTIQFQIGSGLQTIALTSQLPIISRAMMIDATTQPGYTSTPLIVLDGLNAGQNASGLRIQAGSTTVKGLVIQRFSQRGMVLTLGDGNTIQGNYIGTDATGTTAMGNQYGIEITSSSNNLIGGANSNEGNLISGNNQHGVRIVASVSTGNQLEGNKIGTDASGTIAVPNNVDGVSIEYAPSNTITNNLISANGDDGLTVLGTTALNNQVTGNRVGTNASSSAALGNTNRGVVVTNANGTIIRGNWISGNASHGLMIEGSSTNTQVMSNHIGTNASGTSAIGNNQCGIRIEDATNNTVGGTSPGDGNLISGNKSYGICIGAVGTIPEYNQVLGNKIGTSANGMSPLGNLSDGVFINNGRYNTVGGTTSEAGNQISGNSRYGILIEGSLSVGNTISANKIGLNAALVPEPVMPNSVGVMLRGGASNTKIGGDTAGESNHIAGNIQDGIAIENISTNNWISRNQIHDNGHLGIDLGSNGPQENDFQDLDSGPNQYQNYPDLYSALPAATGTYVTGLFHSAPNTEYTLQFYTSPTCDSSGYGEGRTFQTARQVTTIANGDYVIDETLAGVYAPLMYLTAIAIDPDNNTSEFSICRRIAYQVYLPVAGR